MTRDSFVTRVRPTDGDVRVHPGLTANVDGDICTQCKMAGWTAALGLHLDSGGCVCSIPSWFVHSDRLTSAIVIPLSWFLLVGPRIFPALHRELTDRHNVGGTRVEYE